MYYNAGVQSDSKGHRFLNGSGVFPNSVQFWEATLMSKIVFITNLIAVDFSLLSAVKLSLISAAQGKPIGGV